MDPSRPTMPAAELRAALVDDLTALNLPTALLTAKAYEILSLVRESVASGLYLGEVLGYRTDGDHERAETIARAIARAAAVARERRLQRAASLKANDPVARALGLGALVQMILRLDETLESTLFQARRETAQLVGLLAPATTPRNEPSPVAHRLPPFPLAPSGQAVRSADQVIASIENLDKELGAELASVVRYEEELKRRLDEEAAKATDTEERYDKALQEQQKWIDRNLSHLHDLKDEADELATRLSRSLASRTRAARLTLRCAEHRHIVLGTALETALSSTSELMPGMLRFPERRTDFTEVFARFLMLAAGISPDDDVPLTPLPADLPAQATALLEPSGDCASTQTRALITCLTRQGPERRIAALSLAAEPALAPLAATLRSASTH
ncbi:hypothetical protein [Actinomadura gamaensis]|uniref:Uncharacterized protein n=1 Tax=Actinomadura gamaensis TaxID=1763541 RepID=A0ABV9TR31_9ACTN